MTVEEFFEVYEAAKAGKRIVKVLVTRGYIEDFYDREDCNFLKEDMNEIFKPYDGKTRVEYEIYD